MQSIGPADGIETLVKFHPNINPSMSNKILSRTLGKFAVIDKYWEPQDEQSPKSDEFWKVRIKNEIKIGEIDGCFIVIPIKKVEISDIESILPGTYDEIDKGTIRFIIPHEKYRKSNLIVPSILKKSINVNSIIVVYNFESFKEKDFVKEHLKALGDKNV